MKVLVTGATGNIGSEVLRLLLQETRIETWAFARNPMRASPEFKPKGIVLGEHQNPVQVSSSLAGVDSLFLLIPFEEQMVQWGQYWVDAAIKNNVKHIVKISALDAGMSSESKMAHLHGSIDQLIKESRINYTILRCNHFMQNYTHLYGTMIRKHRFFSVPEGQAALASIDTRDIARIAANIVRDPEAHYNKVYDLNGPQALSHAEVVVLFSNALGQAIRYVPARVEDTVQAYRKLGLSTWKIEVLMSLHRFIETGGADTGMGSTADLLGVQPRLMGDFADELPGILRL